MNTKRIRSDETMELNSGDNTGNHIISLRSKRETERVARVIPLYYRPLVEIMYSYVTRGKCLHFPIILT